MKYKKIEVLFKNLEKIEILAEGDIKANIDVKDGALWITKNNNDDLIIINWSLVYSVNATCGSEE